MKILYVITGADIGGAQRHLLYLSEWFKNLGHDVHVVVGENGPLIKELIDRNIGVTVIEISRRVELRKDLKAFFNLFVFIKKGKYDLVHSHSSKAGILTRFAGFFNGVSRNIFTAHGFVFTDPTLSKKMKAIYIFLERVCSWVSTKIITVSAFDYEKGKAMGINKNKMHVIQNGIPSGTICSPLELEVRQEALRKCAKRIVGLVGRIVSEKNIDMLIRVAKLFKERGLENPEFWIVGEGPLIEHYKQEVVKEDLQSIVLFKGNQDNVYEWIDRMHVMIITSHKEGLPYVLLEACSRGLPVVSTDVGGVKQLLDPNNEKKLIVPINDDESMYLRLKTLLSDDLLREYIGTESIKLARNVTVERMCSETNKVYFG